VPKPPRRLREAIDPAVAEVIADPRRRAVIERAGRLMPARYRPVVDVAGWTVDELSALTGRGEPDPPVRVGRDVVLRVNAASGELPVDAVLMSRAIADTAPRAGEDINPTLQDVLERYLPESLSAFELSTRRGINDSAEQLLLTQLRLLHTVALNIDQAETEHNERDLQIQDRFLKERFASLTPGDLDLTGRAPATPNVRSIDSPARGRNKAVTPDARAYLEPERHPVVLFKRDGAGPWEVTLRLALPKGHTTVLGMVEETTTGATLFAHRGSRRLTGRRQTGFKAAQVDLTMPLKLLSPRRFLLYAESRPGRERTDTVLFFRTDSGSQAELRTALSGDARGPLTVIASAYDTPDGLVLRNESRVFPDLAAACAGFGYGNITWLDRHTPIV
jgi:hypothetical protein